MIEYLFSYGTLQTERVQIELFGRVFQGSGDILRGYKTITIEIKDESFLSKEDQKNQLTAAASEDNNEFLKGFVFEITTEELLMADKYEPDNYKRIKVALESGKEAWLYQAE